MADFTNGGLSWLVLNSAIYEDLLYRGYNWVLALVPHRSILVSSLLLLKNNVSVFVPSIMFVSSWGLNTYSIPFWIIYNVIWSWLLGKVSFWTLFFRYPFMTNRKWEGSQDRGWLKRIFFSSLTKTNIFVLIYCYW